MKRPIAELLTLQLKPDAASEHRQAEQETWQILRRKQGYVTHRIYQYASDPLQLGRRARATLAKSPQRLILDLVGPVTSTKGLDLPESAVAATMMKRLPDDASTWHEREARLWMALSKQAGHITHVLFRGFDDPLLVGSLSHWSDASALDAALAHMNSIDGPPHDLTCLRYTPLRD
jgi:hypothetical protein